MSKSASHDDLRDPCPLCGEPNQRHSEAYCRHCHYRLPWASRVENLPEIEPRESRLDGLLQRGGLTGQTARCRFCNRGIDPYARQCPHCQRWLSRRHYDLSFDPWQPDYDAWNSSEVNIPRLRRGGCIGPIVSSILLCYCLLKVLCSA